MHAVSLLHHIVLCHSGLRTDHLFIVEHTTDILPGSVILLFHSSLGKVDGHLMHELLQLRLGGYPVDAGEHTRVSLLHESAESLDNCGLSSTHTPEDGQ